jgi:hypothetical protein
MTRRPRSPACRGGFVLLDAVLALGLVIIAGLTVLGVAREATASLDRARTDAVLTDAAVSTLAALELGLGTVSSLSGPSTGDPSEPADADAPLRIEVQAEPSAFDGLTLARVRVIGMGRTVEVTRLLRVEGPGA